MNRRTSALFELAFTHSSVGRGENYERLEFLGDRVLGMVIARALYDRYPKEPEGYLSRRYNGLVDRETCAENGREIGVPALIRLGKQAREDGASQSENVVGDVVEALIGALFLDGGIEAAERFILQALGAGPRQPARARPSIPSRRSRSLPPRRAASRRSMRSSAAPARTMRPNSRSACRSASSARPWRKARASRKRKPPRPTALLIAVAMSEEPNARRLRRRDRRAQRRQVDTGQCAGRSEGRDRQPQGADDARPADGHRDRGRGADPARRHAGHLRTAPPPRPGDGRGGLDRRAGRRLDPARHRRRRQA